LILLVMQLLRRHLLYIIGCTWRTNWEHTNSSCSEMIKILGDGLIEIICMQSLPLKKLSSCFVLRSQTQFAHVLAKESDARPKVWFADSPHFIILSLIENVSVILLINTRRRALLFTLKKITSWRLTTPWCPPWKVGARLYDTVGDAATAHGEP
jgi:hypothetical protein